MSANAHRGLAILIACLAAFYARAATWHVAENGDDSADGQTWDTPLATISNAVSLAEVSSITAGDNILVSNGIYQLTATIVLTNGLIIESVNSAEQTILDAEERAIRCVWLTSGALLDGFTVTRGNQGGVYFYYGGTVQNCVIAGNTISSFSGGGIYATGGGTLLNSRILNNTATGSQQGGGIFINGGGFTARNCLFAGNEGQFGGGLRCNQGGLIQNCTVVNNHSRDRGGGVYVWKGATFQNTILYNNTTDTDGPNFFVFDKSGVSFNYCCATPALGPDENAGEGNISEDPVFRSPETDDFSLHHTSPCMDAGLNAIWMNNTVDLAGNPRIYNDTVDIGAFEWIRPPGTIIFMK